MRCLVLCWSLAGLLAAQVAGSPSLPQGWSLHYHNGKPYYYNARTGESSWQAPQEEAALTGTSEVGAGGQEEFFTGVARAENQAWQGNGQSSVGQQGGAEEQGSTLASQDGRRYNWQDKDQQWQQQDQQQQQQQQQYPEPTPAATGEPSAAESAETWSYNYEYGAVAEAPTSGTSGGGQGEDSFGSSWTGGVQEQAISTTTSSTADSFQPGTGDDSSAGAAAGAASSASTEAWEATATAESGNYYGTTDDLGWGYGAPEVLLPELGSDSYGNSNEMGGTSAGVGVVGMSKNVTALEEELERFKQEVEAKGQNVATLEEQLQKASHKTASLESLLETSVAMEATRRKQIKLLQRNATRLQAEAKNATSQVTRLSRHVALAKLNATALTDKLSSSRERGTQLEAQLKDALEDIAALDEALELYMDGGEVDRKPFSWERVKKAYLVPILPSRLRGPTPDEKEIQKLKRRVTQLTTNTTALSVAAASKEDLIKELNERIHQFEEDSRKRRQAVAALKEGVADLTNEVHDKEDEINRLRGDIVSKEQSWQSELLGKTNETLVLWSCLVEKEMERRALLEQLTALHHDIGALTGQDHELVPIGVVYNGSTQCSGLWASFVFKIKAFWRKLSPQ